MKRFACLFFCLYTLTAFSQSLTLPRNFLHSYAAGIRTENGKPGANYWQNTASYNIAVNFSPKDRIVAGTEDIIYTNNSPDTLTEIWFKLYPNLYQTGAPRETAIKPRDINEGVRIEKMTIDNVQKLNDAISISATNMHVNVPPLLPGKTIKFTLAFSYVLNKTSHNRTGMIDKDAAFIAYFFPRIAVYDDIDGWNKNPYTGKEEFYNDFCKFNVAVTVPSDYIVCATGNLMNAAEVYAPGIVHKIKAAEQSDGITKIIDTADLRAGIVTIQSFETNTWKFEANDVTDFVFAISNHYIWYASSLEVDAQTRRRTRVDAVFNPAHTSYFNVVNYARKTVQVMSYTFPAWPFPYAHETVFDGLDQMEYPMMVNDNPLEDKADDIELTDHEIFHTMFPFYMGINETKYAWMDEGWATIGEWLISPLIDSSIADDYGIMPTNFFGERCRCAHHNAKYAT